MLKEWLVTDGKGGFAMGTDSGIRCRKYHGFYQGIAGRAETAWLSDLSIECDGQELWPHQYSGPEGPVAHPRIKVPPEFRSEPWPEWTWQLGSGRLAFRIESARPQRGIRLVFSWAPANKARVELRVRPFFAMRDLHSIGGREWRLEDSGNHGRVVAVDGRQAFLLWEGADWCANPDWYRRFHYAEEEARGYVAEEDLFSAGFFRVALPARPSHSCLLVSDRLPERRSPRSRARPSHPMRDFVLEEPPGIVAGFPWFGEWGRDSFVSLPGIVAARLRAGESPGAVADWSAGLLEEWGSWIDRSGMIPNLVEKGGAHQWESADATLWWIHSVAALWSMGFERLARPQEARVGEALRAIAAGRHLFLRLASDGLLEVTEPHTTWMDARVEGRAVTPRTGKLPEINALWFQAHALHKLLGRNGGLAELEPLARAAEVAITETERPNRIFLHSLPLAPSFVFGVFRDAAWCSAWARRDVARIRDRLWTPAGLRTLDPAHPDYRPSCAGSQRQRDEAYHQGAVWPWLGGHFEMAADRIGISTAQTSPPERPIEGHLPEICDAEAPFRARGAPAQAWSLATLEEAAFRRRLGIDQKVRRKLAPQMTPKMTTRGRRAEPWSA